MVCMEKRMHLLLVAKLLIGTPPTKTQKQKFVQCHEIGPSKPNPATASPKRALISASFAAVIVVRPLITNRPPKSFRPVCKMKNS